MKTILSRALCAHLSISLLGLAVAGNFVRASDLEASFGDLSVEQPGVLSDRCSALDLVAEAARHRGQEVQPATEEKARQGAEAVSRLLERFKEGDSLDGLKEKILRVTMAGILRLLEEARALVRTLDPDTADAFVAKCRRSGEYGDVPRLDDPRDDLAAMVEQDVFDLMGAEMSAIREASLDDLRAASASRWAAYRAGNGLLAVITFLCLFVVGPLVLMKDGEDRQRRDRREMERLAHQRRKERLEERKGEVEIRAVEEQLAARTEAEKAALKLEVQLREQAARHKAEMAELQHSYDKLNEELQRQKGLEDLKDQLQKRE